MAPIRNPIEWGMDQLRHATAHADAVAHTVTGTAGSSEEQKTGDLPAVRRISVSDLHAVLTKGLADFRANRTDVIFICLIYPLAGLALARMAVDAAFLPLLFPLASGFALLGPILAVGLYEMSRQREKGHDVGWADAFGVVRSPAFGAILILGLGLLVVFLGWLGAAQGVYNATLGPEPPASLGAFVESVFTTGAGWAMIVIGCGVGFLFAAFVLSVSVVSFPLLLDRNVGIRAAVGTSIRVMRTNPVPMAAWGLIVAGGLVLGTIPVFLGLIVALPILGHATWHLYRAVVE